MSPRTAAQNEALRAATRIRLLDGALKAFSRHGFEGASVSLIAKESGVAQGLLYSHFTGKDALLKAIFERSMDDVRESFQAAAGDDSRTPLERLIRASFDILRRNLGFWRLSYGIRMQEPVLKALGPELQTWAAGILKTLEVHFRAAGALRPSTEAAILFASIDGISQHYALDPGRYPLDAVADDLIAKYAPAARNRHRKEPKPAPGSKSKNTPSTQGGNHGHHEHRNRKSPGKR